MANLSENGSFVLPHDKIDLQTVEEYSEADLLAWKSSTSKSFNYLSIGIVFLGLFGNVVCAAIMGKVQKTVKGVRLIKYLAVVDLLLLLLLTLKMLENLELLENRYIIWVHHCGRFFLVPIRNTIILFETYLTVLIALQRCLVLALPFKFKRLMQDSVLNKLLTGILVFAILFNIPGWIQYKPRFYWNNHYNMTMIWSATRYEILSKEFRFIWTIFRIIICHCIPLLILVVCNISLIFRYRMTRVGPTRDANQTTAIVIAITVMSVLVHALYIVRSVVMDFRTFVTISLRHHSYTFLTIYLSLTYTRDLKVCINSSTNFIFCCTFGREFRRELIAMFKLAFCRQPRQVTIELRGIPHQMLAE